MALLSWISSNWASCAAVLGAVLGVVSMVLHLIPSASGAAASVDSVKADIDKLDGQAK